ncbi:unnamed protein product [Diatraea saccharalis]|uniref:Uncharacterized protein n=1 Tax=Diatraea saccharalis TaxID=40085 RepID=A0A9N9R4V9_9NEOP|nr:unnamed protein product [Diatraea saccharalis]
MQLTENECERQVNNVIRPYLARINDYRPYNYAVTTELPAFSPSYLKSGNRYDYEDGTPLPPIYKVFSNNAKQRVVDVQKQNERNRYNYENKNYAFSYTVKDHKTGDDFSHSQHSSGSATNGEYRVRLPDGRMQIVSYTADENGYQADVRYDDEDKTAGNTIDDHYINNKQYSNDHNSYNNNRNNVPAYVDDKKHYIDYNNKINHEQKPYVAEDKFEYKVPANKDYYNQYTDLSKEYYNDDLSTEYESKSYDYAPHKSKFAGFIDSKNINTDKFVPNNNLAYGSTVTPSYDQLKDLLVTKKAYNTVQPYLSNIPVEINVPSTTPSYDFTTERVVIIGGNRPKLYTSVTDSPSFASVAPLSATPTPVTYNNYVVSSTPRSYLASTIASLINKVDLSGPKPVLSNSYIDRINKYLRFN